MFNCKSSKYTSHQESTLSILNIDIEELYKILTYTQNHTATPIRIQIHSNNPNSPISLGSTVPKHSRWTIPQSPGGQMQHRHSFNRQPLTPHLFDLGHRSRSHAGCILTSR